MNSSSDPVNVVFNTTSISLYTLRDPGLSAQAKLIFILLQTKAWNESAMEVLQKSLSPKEFDECGKYLRELDSKGYIVYKESVGVD